MRLKITAAAALALAAAAALAACDPQDGSGPAANSARQSATPATANTAAGPSAPASPAAPATPAATPSDGIRRVTIAESRALADRGEAVIYDVRDGHSFEANHIKGAKLMPLSEVPARAAEFPKDKLVITYCA